MRCAVVLPDSWTLVKSQEENNSYWVLWNHGKEREVDKLRPAHALPEVWFALTLPTQYYVLLSEKAVVMEQRAAIHSDLTLSPANF